ncbi:hypothetical protein GGI08_006982, partial [Coemansia sp. S2]
MRTKGSAVSSGSVTKGYRQRGKQGEKASLLPVTIKSEQSIDGLSHSQLMKPVVASMNRVGSNSPSQSNAFPFRPVSPHIQRVSSAKAEPRVSSPMTSLGWRVLPPLTTRVEPASRMRSPVITTSAIEFSAGGGLATPGISDIIRGLSLPSASASVAT